MGLLFAALIDLCSTPPCTPAMLYNCFERGIEQAFGADASSSQKRSGQRTMGKTVTQKKLSLYGIFKESQLHDDEVVEAHPSTTSGTPM